MSEQPEEISKLVRLKRYENPPEGYFDDFISEFQSRQRAELLNRSAHGIFCERVATYVSGFGREAWVMSAGAAAAIAVTIFYLVPEGPGGHTTAGGANLWEARSGSIASPEVEGSLPVWSDSDFTGGHLIPANFDKDEAFLVPLIQQ